MPRTRRLIAQEVAMHIMCRGNNRQNIFCDSSDKKRYRSLIEDFKIENEINIYHYCLMDNHVHLIVWLSVKSQLSRFMKQLNLTFMSHYKRKYDYCGHLWQDRFKSNLIDTDSYLLQCGKYIELNPVRAGIVTQPQDFEFSSYRYYAEGIKDSLLDSSPAYLGLSSCDREKQKLYRDFVVNEALVNEGYFERLRYIGSDAFVHKMQEYFQIKNMNNKRGRPEKLNK